ncbi:macrophage mannose receptor 1-like [Asterias rubens]|uniref:macrophage mannose receptor 1-like n=1 Tax=Asterias rubens TaxID=7604 RepID=UPI0014556EDC|nr:macrophage mannose receptor 1-like [Asterias rubens]
MFIYYPTLCSLTANGQSGSASCGGSWLQYGDQCYLPRSDTKVYSEARKACQEEHADLMIIPSQDVNDFLMSALGSTRLDYWMGLYDRADEAVFRWVDGSTSTYRNWKPGEPNDDFQTGEDCVEFDANNPRGEWNDNNCILPRNFVCSRSINVPINCDESAGWRIYNGKCYLWVLDTYSWSGADLYCSQLGGNMVTFTDASEQAGVESTRNINGIPYYIGLTDKGRGRGNYQWIDGTAYSYRNWDISEPNNQFYDAGGNCARVMATSKWAVKECSEGGAFFCERPQGTCAPGWSYNNGQCYQMNINNPKTWTDAKYYCDAQGGYLLTIRNDGENQYITSRLTDFNQVGVYDVYIGISDTISDNSLKWVQSTGSTYTNWATGEPTLTVSRNDCGSIYTGSSSGQWMAKDCYNLQGFICKIQAGAAVTSVPPNMSTGRCDPGWDLNGDSCYYFSPADTATWSTAESICNGFGSDSHLVSVHSAEEQSFLSVRASFVEESHWIGLHDTVGEGNFRWTDGSTTNFRNWGSGEPNNFGAGGDEDCVHLESAFQKVGVWNDINCDYPYRFICKKPKTGNDVNTPAPTAPVVYDRKCGLGWEYESSGDRCYSFRSEEITWEEAENQCHSEGAHLVSIADIKEQQFFYSRVNYLSTGALWIGASDLGGEGGFRWTDGSPFNYFNWDSGEPNNDGLAGENCCDFYTGSGKWNDNKCFQVRPYACKQIDYIQTYFIPSRLRKLDQTNAVVIPSVWPEDCAMACIKSPNCMSFDYGRINMECRLNTQVSSGGLVPTDNLDPFDYYERDFSATTDAPPPTLPSFYNCPSDDWLPYGDSCYYVQSDKTDFSSAQTQCQARMNNANLVSIANLNENNFVLSAINQDLTSDYKSSAWIGMSDLSSEMYYEWLDGTEVTFTNWAYYEPNNQGTEDCVEIYMSSGEWNDINCQGYLFPSVCEVAKGPSGTPPLNTGCQPGWQAYLGSCYKFETSPATWSTARSNCNSMGGNLVSVSHMYDAAYVSAQVGLQTHGTNVWIGMSDPNNSGLYEWADGSAISYTNWGQAQPDSSNGLCVSINSGAPAAGYWYNTACSQSLPYVCEAARPGYTTMAPPAVGTNPTNLGCSAGWIGYGYNCFRVFEVDNYDQKLGWNEAQAFCRGLTDTGEGNLISYHSPDEELYLVNSFLTEAPADSSFGYWIGLNDLANEGGFVWSDGSPVEYENWGNGEPNNYNGIENCAEGFLNADPLRGWNDLACDSPRHWICGVPKNVPVVSPTIPSINDRCPGNSEWYYRQGYCYYVSPDLRSLSDWNKAEEYCHDNGGHLVSIHGEDENTYVRQLVYENVFIDSFWIGLREYRVNGDYSWSDGTPLDYNNWDTNQPDDSSGSEQCAEYRTTGFWNDQNCGAPQPFVCKKPKDSVGPVTHAPATPKEGGCMDSSWLKVHSKCYKVFDGAADNAKTFDDARKTCQQFRNGDIATILNPETQAVLTADLIFPQTDVWIGLTDRGQGILFYWADGTPLDYTNWMAFNPSLNDADGQECVKMSRNPVHPGKWDDVFCREKYGYVCMMDVDPQYDDNPAQISDCPQGFYKYGTACFKFIADSQNFAIAKATCQNEVSGTELVSINNEFEMAFVQAMMYYVGVTEVWIGMELQKETGTYGWVNGWPVLFSAWGENEPSGGTGEGCVMSTTDGRWDDTLCTSLKPFICKYDEAKCPTTVAPPQGTCHDGWKPFGQFCYLFNPDKPIGSFNDAKFDCEENFGAQLVSIHSTQENYFITNNVVLPSFIGSVWIGLQKGNNGLQWTDGTPVDYVFWKEGEPNNDAELCVEMYAQHYGEWNDEQCTDQADYICKMPQMTSTVMPVKTEEPEATKSPQTGGVSAGTIVGIILGVVLLVALVGVVGFFVWKRNSFNAKAAADAVAPTTPAGFDNALYVSSTDKAAIVTDA